MINVRNVKMYLSWCVCIQLLKVIKFTDTLVPKMDLATSVLYAARTELLFFTFVFIISMLAFSQVLGLSQPPHPRSRPRERAHRRSRHIPSVCIVRSPTLRACLAHRSSFTYN